MEKFEKAANIIKVVLMILGVLSYAIWMGVECANAVKDKFANHVKREKLKSEREGFNQGWEAAIQNTFGIKDEAEEI